MSSRHVEARASTPPPAPRLAERRRHAGRLRRAFPAALALCALVAFEACGGAESSTPEAARPRVAHVRLEGPIDVGALALVARGVRTAERQGAETLLIEIDTLGGTLEEATQIERQLAAAHADGLRIACWIRDRAWSAGVIVALSAESIYMSSRATVGSAFPVITGPDGRIALPDDPEVAEKMNSAVRGQFRGLAETAGRPPELAAAMVEPSVEVHQVRIDNELRLVADEAWESLRTSNVQYEIVRTVDRGDRLLNMTAREAVELRFADGVADTLVEVLARLGYGPNDASTVVERSASDRAVVWIEMLTPLLILAALVLGYLELKLPGFGLPGILSAACFLAVVGGKYLAGLADVPHVVAVALGLAFLVLEILVLPGSLWFGITGGVLVAAGLVLGSIGPGWSFADPRLWDRLLDTGIEYALAAVIAVVLALVISRWLPRTPILRRAVLTPDPTVAFAGGVPETSDLPALGALGTALTALRPVGKVAIEGRPGSEFEARSVGAFLPSGARVRVVEVGVGRLVVDAAPGERA